MTTPRAQQLRGGKRGYDRDKNALHAQRVPSHGVYADAAQNREADQRGYRRDQRGTPVVRLPRIAKADREGQVDRHHAEGSVIYESEKCQQLALQGLCDKLLVFRDRKILEHERDRAIIIPE